MQDKMYFFNLILYKFTYESTYIHFKLENIYKYHLFETNLKLYLYIMPSNNYIHGSSFRIRYDKRESS